MALKLTLQRGLVLMGIVFIAVLTVAVGVGTWTAYRWFTDYHTVSTDEDGIATARVVSAIMYNRSELRVSRLSGVVQGTARSSRFWGWLQSSQVVKAPVTVDYFVNFSPMVAGDFEMSPDGRNVVITIPDPLPDKPNVDLSQTSLNEVKGFFVTRDATAEMARKVAASTQNAALKEARLPENIAKARDNARRAVSNLFEGAFRAARVDARIEVRFAHERGRRSERWDVSRSVADVLAGSTRR